MGDPEHDHLPTARLAGVGGGAQVRTAQNSRGGPATQLYRGGADRFVGPAFAQ